MSNNKKEIQKYIADCDKTGEDIIDILVEVQQKYQLDVRSVKRLLTPEILEKLRQQEIKKRTIKD